MDIKPATGRGYSRRLCSRAGAVTAAILALSFGLPAAAYASSTPSDNPTPQVPICQPSSSYSQSSLNYSNLGDPDSRSWGILDNHLSSNSNSLTRTVSSSSSVTYSISATAGVDAGIIFAKVSASVTAGVSYTRAMDGSWSITVNALAHRYGAAGKAAVYAVSHGTQTNVLGNCSLQKITVNYAEFPENIGFDGIAVDNLTSLPHTQPWPLAP